MFFSFLFFLIFIVLIFSPAHLLFWYSFSFPFVCSFFFFFARKVYGAWRSCLLPLPTPKLLSGCFCPNIPKTVFMKITLCLRTDVVPISFWPECLIQITACLYMSQTDLPWFLFPGCGCCWCCCILQCCSGTCLCLHPTFPALCLLFTSRLGAVSKVNSFLYILHKEMSFPVTTQKP